MSINVGEESLRSLLGDLGILGYVGNSILQITQQEQCLINYMGGVMKRYGNSPKSYIVYPSLISPFEFSGSAILNRGEEVRKYYGELSHLVRHGILVRTSVKGEETLVFIGGFDQGWASDVVAFKAYNGGNAYKAKFSVSSNILPGLYSKETGLAVIPFGGGGPQNWYNFRSPAQQVCRDMMERTGMKMFLDDIYQSLWQKILNAFLQGSEILSKYINVFAFGGIMNFVPYIQADLWPTLFYFIPDNIVIVKNEVARYWEINTDILGRIQGISSQKPALTPGIVMLRELDDILQRPTLITFPNSPSSLLYYLSEGVKAALSRGYQFSSSVGLISNMPIIEGSPVLGSQICSTECQGSQGLIGFIGNGLNPLPAPGGMSQFQSAVSLLVPPPRSYQWDDIVEWARTYNLDVNKLNLAADIIVVIAQAARKVAQELGIEEEEAKRLASELEISEEILSKGVENVATELTNLIRSL
ncbi:hypothetical protein L3N51_00137 [Metallosphaera sp. J1]|uniref:hypothetical protein n=1 Tax=Metallosphaera javensis (ex Hofmann et al. 2022) TaxID=99938 RepID=UPI001EDE20FA|nr:hypothetical protein [Metallosphaera javensis (ex Hofmann et al. 2022)]MCG3107868.1 hypothetical protein [Metallosphaera javensis (ex Hofmann et al. 2022)]